MQVEIARIITPRAECAGLVAERDAFAIASVLEQELQLYGSDVYEEVM